MLWRYICSAADIRGSIGSGEQGKTKFGALSRGRFDPNSTAVRFDDPLADGEADACSRIGIPVEPLKDTEDLFRVFRWDAEAIIPDRE